MTIRPENTAGPNRAGARRSSGALNHSLQHLNYQLFFIRPLRNLEFIRDEPTADAITRAVLRILSCAVSEEHARKLTRHLPDPLSMEILRGARKAPSPVSHGECVAAISEQFHISEENAVLLTQTVLGSTKCAVGQIILTEVMKSLGEDWCTAIEGL